MTSKNVILISLDSVRSDVFYEKDLPAIQKLLSEGTSFSNTISSAPLTPVSHTSILSGLQPFNHGIRHLFREQLSRDTITLPRVLKTNGYVTGAFVACAGLNKWYGLHRGFDVYFDHIPKLPDGRNPLDVVDVAHRGSAYTPAEIILEKALSWIENHRTHRFFAFVHFFDAHWPYAPPSPFDALYPDHPYKGEVAYMDSCLGKMLQQLEEWSILDETLIVCLSDHGEDLGDHGGEDSQHPEEAGHGCLLYDTTQKVPLVFRFTEKVPANLHLETQVRLVDVMPTILDLLNIRLTFKVDGRSLKPSFEGINLPSLPAYSETFFPEEYIPPTKEIEVDLKPLKAVRIDTGGTTLKIIWEVGGDGLEIYDLQTDPDESHNLGFKFNNIT